MRIGLIAPVFLPLISGASLYCFELAKALAAYGHDVHLFTPPNGQEDPAYTLHPILSNNLPDDISPLIAHEMDIWHSLYFVYAPMAIYAQPFFITVHGDDAFSFFIPYRLPGRSSFTRNILWRFSPSIQTKIDSWLNILQRIYDKKLANRALHHVNQIITVSTFTQHRVTNAYSAALGRITVIPPGISEMYFDLNPENSQKKSSRKNLLTVTRLDDAYRIKNVHGVIAALGALKDKFDFKYTIVSGTVIGNYRNELMQQVNELGLQDCVEFKGRLSDKELMDCYKQADLFILASYAEPGNFEGFGIVFLEANASGVPVLTTRTGGMADYVIDGENGLYADDPSPEAIANAFIRFFNEEVSFDKRKLRAFAEPFRWKNIASRMLDVYSKYSNISND